MSERLIAIAVCIICQSPLICHGMTTDGALFKNMIGLASGISSETSFRWQTPETLTFSSETYFVRNCVTSGLSRISFDLQTSSHSSVADCRVSIFETSVDSENAIFDSLVFCVSLPIDTYVRSFYGIRHSSGDVSIWKRTGLSNNVDGACVFRTFGNINMRVNSHTNATPITAEAFSEALKADCIHEIVQ